MLFWLLLFLCVFLAIGNLAVAFIPPWDWMSDLNILEAIGLAWGACYLVTEEMD